MKIQLPSQCLESAARWLYATGTAIAATAVTYEIGPTLKALLLALAHVVAAAIVAYARRPRTVRVRRRPNQHARAKQRPCQRRK